MKHLMLLMGIAVTYVVSANILVVDNTPGTGAPYQSLQGGINAASAGDTLMIQPSPISYGSVNLNKSLTLIGPGHFLEAGKNATVGTITIQNGSSNSTITGLHLATVDGGLFHSADNITISRNYFFSSTFVKSTYGTSGTANNWVIEGNVMIENTSCGGCTIIELRSSAFNANWVIRNNIMITRAVNNNTRLLNNLNATTIFYHNIIIHRNPGYIFGGSVGSWGSQSNDLLLQNNIFWVQDNTVDYLENCSNCQFVHNLSFSPGGTIDTMPGSTNLNNVDPQFVQIPGPTNAAFTYDNDYHCMPGSPGATGASDGGMLGVYGGGYRFSNHGDPTGIPRILEMVLENVVIQQGNNATIRMKATGGAQ